MEWAVLGLIVVLGWLVSKLLIAWLPSRPAGGNNFQLMDAIAAAMTYAAIISVVTNTIGANNSEFAARFTFFLISVLILQGAGFLIVQDILGAMEPAPSSLQRCAIVIVFQLIFCVGFLVLIPGWLRWRQR